MATLAQAHTYSLPILVIGLTHEALAEALQQLIWWSLLCVSSHRLCHSCTWHTDHMQMEPKVSSQPRVKRKQDSICLLVSFGLHASAVMDCLCRSRKREHIPLWLAVVFRCLAQVAWQQVTCWFPLCWAGRDRELITGILAIPYGHQPISALWIWDTSCAYNRVAVVYICYFLSACQFMPSTFYNPTSDTR